jgi:hypothetical protein
MRRKSTLFWYTYINRNFIDRDRDKDKDGKTHVNDISVVV